MKGQQGKAIDPELRQTAWLLRNRLGLTYQQVADILQISHQSVHNFAKGSEPLPGETELFNKIKEALLNER